MPLYPSTKVQASPAFTGDPTAPTATVGDADTSVATTAFVAAAISTQATTDSSTYGRGYGTSAVYDSDTLAYPSRPDATVVQWYGPSPPAGATAGDAWEFRPPDTPRPVIWDTDWWTDVDDVLALRLLLHAERLGLVDVRAITIDTLLAQGPGSVDAFCLAEHRLDMPIGAHASYVPAGSPPYQATMFDSWPHVEGWHAATESATTVMRRALAEADDASVDMISVGYMTNFSALLASAADSISALTGLELVTAKCRHLWVMGGQYGSLTQGGSVEGNFTRDATAATAASTVCSTWPTDITFLGYEVGVDAVVGGNLNGLAAADILAKALSDYGLVTGRAAWDPMLTWLACLGDPTAAGYTTVSGTNAVNGSTGVNTWTAGAGTHRYVLRSQPQHWYVADLNSRLLPGQRDPLPVAPPSLVGVKAIDGMRRSSPQTQLVLPARTTTLDTGLIMHLHADDLTDVTGGGTISHWDCRMRSAPVRQHTSAARGTWIADCGSTGLAGVRFATGDFMMSSPVILPATLTVYVRALWGTLPTGNQTLIACDQSYKAQRIFHLKALNAGGVQAVNFAVNGNGQTDSPAGTLVATNTWYTLILRMNSTSLEGMLDGVGNGATGTTNCDSGTAPIVLGGRYSDTATSNEQMVGDIREVRVYNVLHDDSTVTAVAAAMAP
jgi:hypothetical protein